MAVHSPPAGTSGGAVSGTTGTFSSLTSGRIVLAGTAGLLQDSALFTYSVANGAFTLGGATVTASAPILNLTQTWNNAGVTFTGILANITSTASAAGSLLLDLQVAGSTVANFNKTGALTILGNGSASASLITVGPAGNAVGLYVPFNQTLSFSAGAAQMAQMNSVSFNAALNAAIPAGGTSGAGITWSNTSNFGIFFGSGAPSLSAAKGSLYLRSDGTGIADRAYINTNGSTTWTNLVTAA